MPLPRFNSGSLGRLTFADINEMCVASENSQKVSRVNSRKAAIEPVRKDLFVTLSKPPSTAPVGDVAFAEVRLNSSTQFIPPYWQLAPNGLTTGAHRLDNGQLNPNYQPCYFLRSVTGFYTSDLVGVARLTWFRSEEGRGYWIITARERRAEAFPAEITSKTATSPAPLGGSRWLYSWREVVHTPSSSTFNYPVAGMYGGVGLPNGAIQYGTALNGAEYSTPQAGGSGATVTRLAIQIGEIVSMSFDNNNGAFFHARNEYSVNCL